MEDRFKLTEKKLYNYKDIEKLNDIADIKIKKLKNDISLGGGDMFGEKSSPTNQFHSIVENNVLDREKNMQPIIDRLENEKVSRIIEKELIEKSLELLEEEERNLVKARYFNKPTKSWDSIAFELNQSKDNCIKVRRKIIERLSDYIL